MTDDLNAPLGVETKPEAGRRRLPALMPVAAGLVGAAVLGSVFDSGVLEMSQRIVIGALIIAFLIAEPRGLIALVDRAANVLRRLRSSQT